MFSLQKGFCRICGKEIEWSVGCWPPYTKKAVCGKECNKELNWRETLSIMGKEYYPDPTEVKDVPEVH